MTATRDLVRIGQSWQKRGRYADKPVVRIRQVHRADRQVEAIAVGKLADGADVRVLRRLTFAELRAGYRLIDGAGR